MSKIYSSKDIAQMVGVKTSSSVLETIKKHHLPVTISRGGRPREFSQEDVDVIMAHYEKRAVRKKAWSNFLGKDIKVFDKLESHS